MSVGHKIKQNWLMSSQRYTYLFCTLFLLATSLFAAPQIDVSIIEPQNNDCVGGTMPIKVVAVSNSKIDKVEFYLDKTRKSIVREKPYISMINFTSVKPGDHTLEVRAWSKGKFSSTKLTLRKPTVSDFDYGATLYANGAYFKVWAPSAKEVVTRVGGYFNDNIPFHELETRDYHMWRSGEDWHVFIPNVKAWQKYMFQIKKQDGYNKLVQDPYARQMEKSNSSIGASVIVDAYSFKWTDQDYRIPRHEDMVIYEIHVGSFCGNGDGLKFPCRYLDVESKIPYLKKLGVNMVQIMPVHEFKGEYSWGYNPSGFFAPESAYQSENPAYYDLKHMINEFHRNGIGVIIDVVYSHASVEDNYLWEFDGPENVYFDWGIVTDWGAGFSFGKNQVKKFLIDNALYWIKEFHADGLRFDTANWITKTGESGWNCLRDLLSTVKYHKPESIMIAEYLPNDPVVTNHLGFDSQWFVDLHHYLEFEMKKPSGAANLDMIKRAIGWDNFAHNTDLVKYSESHDEVGGMNGKQRLIQELGGRYNEWAVKKANLAASMLLASPGVPMLFMGQEFLQDGKFADDRFHAPFWGYEFDEQGREAFALYRDLLNTRWLNPALRSNTLVYTHQDNVNKVIAFRRWSGDGNVTLIVANFSDNSYDGYNVRTGLNDEYKWHEIFNSDSQFYGGDGRVNFGDKYSSNGKIHIKLGRWSLAIFNGYK